MTKYRCTDCGMLQYTSDTKSKSPCIHCGGKNVKKEDDNEKR